MGQIHQCRADLRGTDYVLATPDVAEALAERIAVAITEFYGEIRRPRLILSAINDRHFERLCKLPVGTVPPEEPSSPLVQVASAVGAAMDMVGRRFNAVTTGRGGAGRWPAARTMCGEADGRLFEWQPLMMVRLPRPLLSRARFTRCPAVRPGRSNRLRGRSTPPGISRRSSRYVARCAILKEDAIQ